VKNVQGHSTYLASDLIDAVLDQLDGVGVGEQLIPGENVLEDLHFGELEGFSA